MIKIKCYFSLTEPDEQDSVYLDLLYVSLKSARQNTTLDLYVLYDGSTTGRCYEIMKEFDVHIIKHKFSHKEDLKKVYTDEFILQYFDKIVPLDKIAGSFMRLDIPFIEKEDEYVLYTDIDVMFLKDFSDEDFGKPEYLAATSEFDKDLSKAEYFNCGIIYMNIKKMREISNQIFEMLEKGIRCLVSVVDQGYLNQACFDKYTLMPQKYNWKPYWGYNEDAYIVHLHAMKPGGNYENSGFGMTEYVLYYSLMGHEQDIDGYVYYMMKYYEFLGKDGKKWIAKFISEITRVLLLYAINENKNKEPEKKTMILFAEHIDLIEDKLNKLKSSIDNVERKISILGRDDIL